MPNTVLIIDNRGDRLQKWAIRTHQMDILFELKDKVQKEEFERSAAGLVLCHYGNGKEVWSIEGGAWPLTGKRVVFFSDSNSDHPDTHGRFVHISARYLRDNFVAFIREQLAL